MFLRFQLRLLAPRRLGLARLVGLAAMQIMAFRRTHRDGPSRLLEVFAGLSARRPSGAKLALLAVTAPPPVEVTTVATEIKDSICRLCELYARFYLILVASEFDV